jgi:glycosyltransferase involved in cell wall biosynthesis
MSLYHGQRKKMIKVGFIGAVSKEWMGGLNYFKNLLYAISNLEKKEFEILVFVGINTDQEIKTMFEKYATVVEDTVFDKKCLKWYLHKIENKFLRTNYILEGVLKKQEVQVLSHANIVNLNSIKTISWIPDFQHLHLPNMFSQKEIKSRNDGFIRLIKDSDKIVLSSYDAFNDFKTFAIKYEHKADVLQFVSQPDKKYFTLTIKDEEKLRQKYGLKDEFFYMPNQFWKHKNHMLVFKAVKILVEEGSDVCVVCTGHLEDYRNKNYIEEIKNFVRINKLEKHIKLLGLVDYEDVFSFIKFSKAVINPSLFEGWSSTVEECKSVCKNMILSDLNVHKEQYTESTFFQRNDVVSLKNTLANYEISKKCEIKSVDTRTRKFAQKYVDIVNEILKDA